ncbi:MAG: glycine--tRNA ligase subunit beta [Gammaproteobacteria bacterium]|nr:glycine--tRNA ligase subunit beta [Gammaproteobacteria bacterium]
MKNSTRDLLIEIGTEELPPKALATLAEDFHDRLQAIMNEQLDLHEPGITKSRYYYSPRRLAVVIDDLRIQQPERLMEKYGPALKIAYDDSGKPTKAAEGFRQILQCQCRQIAAKGRQAVLQRYRKRQAGSGFDPGGCQ